MLSHVPSTGALQAPVSYCNPLWQGCLADPFVFAHEKFFYALGTGPSGEGGRQFPVLRSTDLATWDHLGGALKGPDVAGEFFWAPEVAFASGVFYMYYSVGGADHGHQLRVATSRTPEGPYEDAGHPLLDPADTSFAIDPHPFQDMDGQWYLFYARDFLSEESGARCGTALVLAPLTDMLHLSSEFRVVMRARHDWQRYEAGRSIYGGVYDWHTLEGPCVVTHQNRYYCLYSGGNWHNDSYGVDFAVAESVLGPWQDTNASSFPRVLRSVSGQVIGPGHNSVFSLPDGRQYIAYHAWTPAMDMRRLHIDRLVWTDAGPRCVGPTWTPCELNWRDG
jgi:beta-xylosidase